MEYFIICSISTFLNFLNKLQSYNISKFHEYPLLLKTCKSFHLLDFVLWFSHHLPCQESESILPSKGRSLEQDRKGIFLFNTLQQKECGEGNGTPLQYSCLENPMDRGAWWGAVHGVAKSRTRLSDFTFTFHFHVLEKEMATHSSVLVWRIPGTAEPGGLLSKGSHRVRHDSSDLAAAACHIYKTYLFPKLLNNLTLLKISNSSFCWLF